MDATFPYKSKLKYVCHVRIIDQSYERTKQVTNVIIFGKEFDQMPIINWYGDILRVHWAERQEGKDQLIVNLCYRSSWCLFIIDPIEQPLEPKFLKDA